MRRLWLGLQLNIPGLWLHYAASRGDTIQSTWAWEAQWGWRCKQVEAAKDMAYDVKEARYVIWMNISFLDPLQAFMEQMARMGGQFFHRGVGKKVNLFYRPSNHIMQREPTLLTGKALWPWVNHSPSLWTSVLSLLKRRGWPKSGLTNSCLQGRASQVNGSRDQVGTFGNSRILAQFRAGQSLSITYRLLPRVNADQCHQMAWFSREARIPIFISKNSILKSCHLIPVLKKIHSGGSQNHHQVACRTASLPPLTKRVTRDTYHWVPGGGDRDCITQRPNSPELSFAAIHQNPPSFLSLSHVSAHPQQIRIGKIR